MKKKLIPILILQIFFITGCGSKDLMPRIMSSWNGCTVDEVISQWGYPTNERTIAGKKLLYWEDQNTAYVPQSTNGHVNSSGYMYANTYGGYYVNKYCTRILEINDTNKVIGWQWKGNDCPFAEWFEYKNWRNKNLILKDELYKQALKAYSWINYDNITKDEKEKISLYLNLQY